MYFHSFQVTHQQPSLKLLRKDRMKTTQGRPERLFHSQEGDQRDGSTVRSAVFLQKTKLAPKLACPKLPLIPSDLKPLVL